MSAAEDRRKSGTSRKSSGDKEHQRSSGQRPPAGRHLSVGAASNSVDYDDDFFEDDGEAMTRDQLRRRVGQYRHIFSV